MKKIILAINDKETIKKLKEKIKMYLELMVSEKV